MGLGNEKPVKYLSISKEGGKVRHKDGEAEHLYDYLEARLDRIELKTEEWQGSEYTKYYFWFSDGGVRLCLQSSEGSSFSRSLINSIASLSDPSTLLRVRPYEKERGERTFTVPYVTLGSSDESLSWAVPPEKIPTAERVKVGDKQVLNDSERRKFFRQLAATINKKLETKPDQTGAGRGIGGSPSSDRDEQDSGTPDQSPTPASPSDVYGSSSLGEGLPEGFDGSSDDLPF